MFDVVVVFSASFIPSINLLLAYSSLYLHCKMAGHYFQAAFVALLVGFVSTSSNAFVPIQAQPKIFRVPTSSKPTELYAAAEEAPTLKRVSEEEEGIPIPFLDNDGKSFIECYADSVAVVDGEEYTIGVPCDYAVALCYFEDDNLLPVELTDSLMDDIFPIAENIVAEEFGEELALQRTPQTLTLVGELEEDEDDDDMDDIDDDDDMEDGEEEVEVLLSFEHRGTEFNLVRLLDPILLVGKQDPEREEVRRLLTPEESDKIMPLLEDMFLEFHEDQSNMLP
jgi:hypothetical protein